MCAFFGFQYIQNKSKYDEAINLYNDRKFDESREIFVQLGDFLESEDKIKSIDYDFAKSYMIKGEFDKSIEIFTSLNNYLESEELLDKSISLKEETKILYDAIASDDYRVIYKVLLTIRNYDIVNYLNLENELEIKLLNQAIFNMNNSHFDGGYYSVAFVQTDGTVLAYGNYFSSLENDTFFSTNKENNVDNWSNIVSISYSTTHLLGLKSDGTVIADGYNHYGQLNVEDWNDIIAISAGEGFSVGLRSDGTLVGVGQNDKGQLNFSTWKDVISIGAGYKHTAALTEDGKILSIGYYTDQNPDLKKVENIKNIDVDEFDTVGITFDNKVITIGGNYYNDYYVEEWDNVIDIAAGQILISLTNESEIQGLGFYANEFETDLFLDLEYISASHFAVFGLRSDGSIVVSGDSRIIGNSINFGDIKSVKFIQSY